jgi:uncharacterized protein YndB with AHSA1/START domain
MTYELRIERLFDVPPEVVFDTLVDPDAQPEIFAEGPPGYSLMESRIDLRVGGTSRWSPSCRAGSRPKRIATAF